MQQSNAPDKLVLPFAAAGAKNTIPVNSQVGITPGAASLEDGFPPLTRTPLSAGGVPPSGLDFNGIFYEMSNATRWANAGGGYPYDATFATDVNVGGYPKGARVLRSDGEGFWLNLVDNNITNPDTGGAGWVPDLQYGIANVTMTSSNVTLTALEAGKPIIVITGLLTTNLNLIFPNYLKSWTVANNTTGAFSITAKTAAGTGAVIAKNTSVGIYGDGTNIYSNITLPDATTTTKGVVELATDAETQAGTDTVRAVTPAGLQSKVASETAIGLVELATDAEAQAGTANKFIDGAKLRSGLNASGSAPIYACRAWVSFNGTGTPSIVGSGNISSITDVNTGRFVLNFTTAMPDGNYAVVGSCGTNAIDTAAAGVLWATARTTSSCRISTTDNSTDAFVDNAINDVFIMR